MDSMVFVVLLFVTTVTRTATLTIEATSDTVTVREGEQLTLSCSIKLDNQGLRKARWYRGSDQLLYGSIDITLCGISPLCLEVNTTDNRGVVQYTRSFNDATLTLVIDHTLARDNTTFSCGLLTTSGTFPMPDNVHVIVQHFPDPTFPMCLRSNSSTNADILSFSCWAEITQPVVSLEWTVEGSSSERISLSHQTEIYEDRVENTLFLNEPSGSLVFTCNMTSSAFPQIQRNCSIEPILIPVGQTTASILPSPEQTTAGFLPDPFLPDPTTTTPQNDVGSMDRATTPFSQDGMPTTLTTKIITQIDPPLNTIVIAAIVSACLVVIIILLIIIACLVSSRRTRSRGEAKTDPKDLSIRLSVAITAPGSNTNLSHEAHVYSNETVPALSSTNRPGRLEIPPWDHTASHPPSPLYAAVSSVKKAPQIGDSSYAVVSKRDKRRGNSPLEHQPNMGHGSQDPPEYHTLEPGARQLSQGQEPESTEGQFEYAIPGQGSRSWRSSQLDEDDGKLIDNVLYTTQNEYM
ncbi:uncharacterized protein [Asterias amurensis]|uniref:uncharacterized protein isoform X2 n=1 Tax=Asterias amurensis TaxID=7602 RepID=UPI003AB48601